MIVKSNIFDKINNYVSIDMVEQVFKWRDSKIFCSAVKTSIKDTHVVKFVQ